MQAFLCFKAFFIRYNKLIKFLRQENVVIVLSGNVVGIQVVWNIAFNAQETEVKNAATEFIVELFSKIDKSIKSTSDVSRSLVSIAIDNVNKKPEDNSHKLRLIQLIKSYIIEYK